MRSVLFTFFLLAAGILFLSDSALAYPNGITGYTLKTNASGCGACHGTHGSATSMVHVIVDGPAELLPGATGDYTVTISGGSGNDVGVDIAVSSGTLAKVDNNLKVLGLELVQSSPRNYSGGSYTYYFEYTAPSTAGDEIIYVTGMGKKKEWNFADNFSITIGGTTLNSQVAYNEGWNLVSVPLAAGDMSVSALFPDASSDAFGFNGSYRLTSELENGEGYWIKFSQQGEVTVSGADVAVNIPVSEGWNLVGPFHEEIAVSSITSDPAGIISSNFFEFDNGYLNASTLIPGKGYWVNCTSAGVLIPGGKTIQKLETNFFEKEIIFTDSRGLRGSLYLSSKEDKFSLLPPLPPDGIFDVRFSSGYQTETLDRESLKMELNSAEFPVMLTGIPEGYSLIDVTTGERIKNNDGQYIIDNSIPEFRKETAGAPTGFELLGNYPNPFNPSTIISYQMDNRAQVKLEIFSVTGESSVVLVNEIQEAGLHEVNFDASEHSSGVYIYMLNINNKSLAGKMLLAK